MVSDEVTVDVWVELDTESGPQWTLECLGEAMLVFRDRATKVTVMADDKGLAMLTDTITAARTALAAEPRGRGAPPLVAHDVVPTLITSQRPDSGGMRRLGDIR